MTDQEGGRPGRSGRRTLPIWVVAILGFAFGFAISGWIGGIIGVGFVLLVSRFL